MESVPNNKRTTASLSKKQLVIAWLAVTLLIIGVSFLIFDLKELNNKLILHNENYDFNMNFYQQTLQRQDSYAKYEVLKFFGEKGIENRKKITELTYKKKRLILLYISSIFILLSISSLLIHTLKDKKK